MSGVGSKSAVAAVVLATIIVSGTTATKAENGQIAAGIAGGLIGGALIGGALAGPPVYAPPPPPVYYEPSYEVAPVVVEEPACTLVREQFWDGYGYRVRRYRVCD